MRAMRDSGLRYLGSIPVDWEMRRLRFLFNLSVVTGKSNERVLSLYREYGVIPKDSRDDNHNVTSLDRSNYKFVELGDFVVNKMKAWQGSMALSRYQGIVSPAYHVFKFTSDSFFPGYAHYLLRSTLYADEWRRLSTGLRVGQWDLHVPDFYNTWVCLPPVDEQQRIADFLDDKCAEIDRAIAAAEASISEYGAYLGDVTYRTVMGYKDDDVERIETGIEWLGNIPSHWKLVPFRHLYREVSIDGHENEELLSVYLNRGVIRYSESDGMQVHKPSDSLSKYQLVVPGNLVLNNQQAWRGSVGVSFHRGIISPAYHVYEQIGDCLDNGYANLLFRGPWVPCFTVSSTGVGSIQRNVSKGQLKSELVPIPPKHEQIEIVHSVLQAQIEVEKIIRAKQSIIDDLKTYKQSLIYEVVTGKREV